MTAWFISKVRSRMLRRNKNWLCVICGPTGSGKSYCALRLGEIIDSNFSIDNVVFTPQDFMALINSGNLKKGAIIVFDEAGVGMAAREWYSISNKAVNYVLQTFRFMNIGVIFTVPDFKFIDAQARKLFHTYIETLSVNRERKIVITKVKQVQNNPQMGKLYIKYYRKGKQAITRNNIGKPSNELIKLYEQKKKRFAQSLNVDVQSIVKGVRDDIEKKKIKTTKTAQEIADEIIANPEPYLKQSGARKYINRVKIENDYKIGIGISVRVKQMVEDELDINR